MLVDHDHGLGGLTLAPRRLTRIEELSADRKNFGDRLTRKQLEGWVRRNRLVKAGARPGGPKAEMALYRAGDVLALVGERLAS